MCERRAVARPAFKGMEELNEVRRALRARSWMGVDENGIGFGNLSLRDGEGPCFFITGSSTGAIAELGAEQYARVVGHDLERNWLRCEGVAIASSESLTHAAIYEAAPTVRAVLHCHSAELWRRWRHLAPTTSARAEYGTPLMAREVLRLFRETAVLQERFFVMAGHVDGVVAFGSNLALAMDALVQRAVSLLPG
ncbi:MAG: class II aldolase/adducin family protein [Chthoniobacterales bacterium]